MRRLKLFLLAALLSTAATCQIKPPKPPTPPPVWTGQIFTHVCSALPCESGNEPFKIPGASVTLNNGLPSGTTDGAGNYIVTGVKANTYRVCADMTGYLETCGDITLPPQFTDVFLVLKADIPVRTRDQVINVKTSGMQGLTVVTSQFGSLPWFEAALPWLDQAADRQAVYAAKHAAGDTHCLLQLPFGPVLYNEEGNAYAPSKGFGPKDWTTDYSKLVALVDEINQNGFVPVIFLGGDGPDNYPVAVKQLPEVVNALGHDRMKTLLVIPGWDSVFYGWEPVSKIVNFGAQFRSLCADCFLGIEMGSGHIPLGEGPSDWTKTGRMKDYDTLLIEYNPSNVHEDSVWQINGRLFGPRYVRPADQPSGDDPHPPWYLGDGSPRGPYAPIPFEVTTYFWVRSMTKAQSDAMTNYVLSTVRQ